ncbi:cytochrome c [Cocleimonas sp. KMM 6892]|uniref:c-type cytochrome n=1 Tax=unclassified Cocleimonas TaxID=2639732 RepID=UPI002DBFE939|nr:MULTISPECIES: cytochrome c [unclassified Cocleimonas]MEB8430634.1 cytochrome c [Cocleimonas sp. KMM 6892]MEC4716915.1 cytochrome c [Cocleimonas sp. KMM 6895]MEC4743927.1 cytochrome c [Cocleimonas sp. KMM 6896]
MSKKILLATTLMLVMSPSVFAADGEALYASKGCLACHGADGKSPIAPAYPKVVGQSKEYTEQQMKDIKSGVRSNGQSAVMKGIMAAVTDEEIKAIAEFLASSS